MGSFPSVCPFLAFEVAARVCRYWLARISFGSAALVARWRAKHRDIALLRAQVASPQVVSRLGHAWQWLQSSLFCPAWARYHSVRDGRDSHVHRRPCSRSDAVVKKNRERKLLSCRPGEGLLRRDRLRAGPERAKRRPAGLLVRRFRPA